jgi:rare lipoprotein A
MKYLLILCVIFLIAAMGLRARPVVGTASFYSDRYQGLVMANGERFNQAALTCASNRWPLGTKLRIRHGSREVVVTVTDRGPRKDLNRMVDLSKAAFKRLGPLKAGLLNVEAKVVSKP